MQEAMNWSLSTAVRPCAVAGLALALLTVGLPPVAAETGSRTFYVSPVGRDDANGLSAATAWRSLQRASNEAFRAGDQLLLQGGARFPGMLAFDARDTGTVSAPVQVGSYGLGRATITASGTPAVYAYNTAGLSVRDLVVRGDAASLHSKGGLSFYSDLPAGRRLAGLRVQRVDAAGFRNGIEIGGRNASAGFSDVAISDSVLHDNLEAGLATYGPAFNASRPSYANASVRVTRVQAHHNLGDPANLVRNTGSGIILGSVVGGSVVSSSAWENGARCRAPEGPVGIWTYDSHGIRIAGNHSHHNRTGGPADGDGFDLDQNVSGSVMENNLSESNDGAGYLVFTAQANSAHHDNVVRNNRSLDDARKNPWYGGITVVGRIVRTQVYGNVVSTSTSPVRSPALALGAQLTGVTVTGNYLRSVSGGTTVAAPGLGRGAALLSSNRWPALVQRVRWGALYPSVPTWRTATGHS